VNLALSFDFNKRFDRMVLASYKGNRNQILPHSRAVLVNVLKIKDWWRPLHQYWSTLVVFSRQFHLKNQTKHLIERRIHIHYTSPMTFCRLSSGYPSFICCFRVWSSPMTFCLKYGYALDIRVFVVVFVVDNKNNNTFQADTFQTRYFNKYIN